MPLQAGKVAIAHLVVIPADAGIQAKRAVRASFFVWAPASAGVTSVESALTLHVRSCRSLRLYRTTCFVSPHTTCAYAWDPLPFRSCSNGARG